MKNIGLFVAEILVIGGIITAAVAPVLFTEAETQVVK